MSTSNPKITIVLPTYNGARWLRGAIESVLNQTERSWELIIVDDCSSDSSFEIASLYARDDERIQVISNEVNKKLPASLNVGFQRAKGRYLTWTSDDNVLKPEMLEKLAAYLDEHPNVDMIVANHDFIDEQGDVVGDWEEKFQYERNAASLLLGCNVGAAFMYRKEIALAIGAYDTSLFCAEDYDYWCRIALAGEIAYSNENLYQYRNNPNSLSVTKKKQVREKALLIKKKYAEPFFERFGFTELDRAKFWLQTSFSSTPIKYSLVTTALFLYSVLLKIVLIPMLLDKKRYKQLRNQLGGIYELS